MVTKTTISALRTLTYLAGREGFVALRGMAGELDESPTYLAKVTRLLVRDGILQAGKGAKGGVRLGRAPEAITLLSVVEACQGHIAGTYCQPGCDPNTVCPYHRAAIELERAVIEVLNHWSLRHMLADQSHARENCLLERGVRR
jgi:Rrf2 family protein